MLDILRKLNCMFSRRHRMALLVLLVLMLVGALLEALGLSLLPAFVLASVKPGRFLDHARIGPALEHLNVTTPRQLLMGGSLILFAVFTLKSAYQCVLYYALARFIWNRQVQLGHTLFSAYMGVPYEFILQHNTAELKRNVFGETTIVATQAVKSVLDIAMHGILALIVAAVLFVAQPMAALAGITVLVLAAGAFLSVTRFRVEGAGRARQKAVRAVIQAVEEGLGSFKDARVLGTDSFFSERYHTHAQALARAMKFKHVIGRISQPVLELIAVSAILGVAMILLFLGRDVASIAPVLALFAAALLRLRFSANHLAIAYNDLRHSIPAVSAVHEHLTQLGALPIGSAPRKKRGDGPVLPFADRIAIESVTYAYPNTVAEAVRDINITIPKGASVALVGRTGSGKSTLVDVLLGLLTPQSGHLKVDGVDIASDPAAWRRNLGYVPQVIRLIDDSIRSNVALGVPRDEIDEERLDRAVRTAQLKEMVDALPGGLDTVVGEQGVRISGGERQRIAIARALYRNPDVLVLDEATSDLDNTTERNLMRAIAESAEGDRTLIMIAHRLTTVESCDRLYFLEAGRLEDSGSYEELVNKNTMFRRMVESEVDDYDA